jgi:nucleotide-binding universal stress UspA family protein
MFRYILVPATGAPSDEAVFRSALAIARLDAGHLDFLHVRIDMQETAFAVAGRDMAASAYGRIVDFVHDEVEGRQGLAHASVMGFCAREMVTLSGGSGCRRSGPIPYCTREQARLAETAAAMAPSAAWRVEAGDEPQCLVAHSRTADLTVLGRGHDGGNGGRHLLETLLLHSGRPMVVVPETVPASVGRHIAIAWKDTAEAARAVAAALPLVAHAETVTVVAVQEPSDTRCEADSGKRLLHSLRWHNSATTLRTVPPSNHDPVDSLLSVASEDRADLLVMGGYSHSRMHEAMFGGFTRRMLQAAPLPVLMAH